MIQSRTESTSKVDITATKYQSQCTLRTRRRKQHGMEGRLPRPGPDVGSLVSEFHAESESARREIKKSAKNWQYLSLPLRVGMLDFPDSSEQAPTCDSVQGEYRRAAVVSNTEYGASVGRELLEKGGSAVDALIGTLLCDGLCAMQNLGLGGGCFITLYSRAEGKAYCLNAREKAPARASPDMFKGDPQRAATGPLSIAVPGELMGYWEAHRKFGRLPWTELFRPAITMCLEGVPINRRLGKTLSDSSMGLDIMASPSLRRVLGLEGGRQRPVGGDRLRLPRLGRTLGTLAGSERGAWELYDGVLSEGFLSDLKALGSLITREDLISYRAVWSEPVSCQLSGGVRLYSQPPPASGPLLLFILRLLDGLLGSNPCDNINPTIEAFKFAYAARTLLGDPDYANVRPVLDKLASDAYINEVKSKISSSEKTNGNPKYYGAKYDMSRDAGTGNVVVMAPNGDVAVATSTINTMFGSLLASESTGIIFNNEMDDFSSPHIVNSFGLPPSPANGIAGGKRPLSSSCPSVLVEPNGAVRLAVGAAGGSFITTSNAQVIMNYLWFNQSIKKSVDLPRIHHQLMPMHLRVEEGIAKEVVARARAAGHKVERKRPSSSVTAIARSNQLIHAIYDCRRGGSTDGF